MDRWSDRGRWTKQTHGDSQMRGWLDRYISHTNHVYNTQNLNIDNTPCMYACIHAYIPTHAYTYVYTHTCTCTEVRIAEPQALLPHMQTTESRPESSIHGRWREQSMHDAGGRNQPRTRWRACTHANTSAHGHRTSCSAACKWRMLTASLE